MSLDLELTQAILAKDLKNVRMLVQRRIKEKGANAVNLVLAEGDFTGCSLLAVAAFVDDIAIIGYLLAQKAKKEKPNTAGTSMEGYTPLLVAAEKGSFNAMKYFIEIEHLPVDTLVAINKRKLTVLYVATSANHENIVNYLLQQGANPVAEMEQGLTSIHKLANNGRIDLLTMLDRSAVFLNRVIDYNHTTHFGETALCSAVAAGHDEIVRYLLEDKKADANIHTNARSTNPGSTPLHLAVIKGNVAAVRLLLSHGAIPSATYNTSSMQKIGVTPLHLAAEHGHLDIARLLIGCRVYLNAPFTGGPWQGTTPLHLAAQNGHLEMARLLLTSGAIPNTISASSEGFGVTPLHSAVYQGHLEVARLLLERGANPNGVVFEPKIGVVKPPLFFAAEKGNLELVQLLLERGADVTLQNSGGDSAETYAFKLNQPPVVERLKNYSALCQAADKNDLGAMIDLVTKTTCLARVLLHTGDTLLHCVVKLANQTQADEEKIHEFIQLLLKNGVDKHARDKKGRLAIEYAREGHQATITNLLTLDLEKQLNLIIYNDATKKLVRELLSGEKTRQKDTVLPNAVAAAAVAEKKINTPASELGYTRKLSNTEYLSLVYRDRFNTIQSFIDAEPGIIHEPTRSSLNALLKDTQFEFHNRIKFGHKSPKLFTEDEISAACRILENLTEVIANEKNCTKKSTLSTETSVEAANMPVSGEQANINAVEDPISEDLLREVTEASKDSSKQSSTRMSCSFFAGVLKSGNSSAARGTKRSIEDPDAIIIDTGNSDAGEKIPRLSEPLDKPLEEKRPSPGT